MTKLLLVGTLLVGLGASAVAAPQAGQPAGRGASQAPTRSAADVITIVACVQRESEYRAKVQDGRGGVAGSGIGADNEFVLHSIRTVSNETLKPTTTPRIEADAVYSVTGNLERELTKAVGRQIATTGYVEVATTAATAQVKDLPRFNAVGWHIVSESCGPGARGR
jgi:hypothetical protein